MSKKPKAETRMINLFEFLGEGLIRKLEEQPIQIEIHFADCARTFDVPKKHPWYKELKRRRDSQIASLRAKREAWRRWSEPLKKTRGRL